MALQRCAGQYDFLMQFADKNFHGLTVGACLGLFDGCPYARTRAYR